MLRAVLMAAGAVPATGDEIPQDWRGWQAEGAPPEPPLLTRSEVLALVERWRVAPPVDERTMRYWEKRGLLPRPTRSYHAGATRSRYPSWVADLIASIRLEQKIGRKLADLGPRVHEEARRLSRSPRPHPFPAKPYLPEPGKPPSLWDYIAHTGGDGPRYEPQPFYAPPILPSYAEFSIARALEVVLRQQYTLHDFETARITVHLANEKGEERIYHVPIPDWFDVDPSREIRRTWLAQPSPFAPEQERIDAEKATDTR